jgi:2-methoxy-6-polyprenyl-1,4-benzoquinol methylase
MKSAMACVCSRYLRQSPLSILNKHCSTYSNEKQTHFGFKDVGEQQKKEAVLNVFHSVADTYDLMNDAMSLGIHRVWKDEFIKMLAPGPRTKLLDVAGGTGDISFRFLEHVGKEALTSEDGASVTVCDINNSMLKVGEERAQKLGHKNGISWVEGDAQELPFPDSTFDCYTIAFGIRNVVRIDLALSEAYRVLKPGGRFMCLEFSKVSPPELESLYDMYSFQVIPPLGKLLAGDWDSYQYLVESIRKFPDQDRFAGMLKEAGFRFVKYENFTFGVAAIHSGYKL